MLESVPLPIRGKAFFVEPKPGSAVSFMDKAFTPRSAPAVSLATWSIAEVERETGLGKDALRVWERRYGFPVPDRDALGERVYPQVQVERLRLIKRLLDAGHRPGKVVPLSELQLQALVNAGGVTGRRPAGSRAPAAPPEPTPLARQALKSLPASEADTPWLQWLAEDRTDQVKQALKQQILRLGLGTAVDHLVGPLCVEVGEAWMRGELSVYQEHLFTETLQGVLREAIAQVDTGGQALQRSPRVLLTTVPNEQHGLGLLMAECHFALESCVRFVLGVSTPVADIVQAARQLEADLVALSFSAYATRRDVLNSLQQLAEQLPEPVEIWAGGASATLRGRSLPGRVTVLRQASDVAEQVRRWRERQASA